MTGFVLDEINSLCYRVLDDLNHFEAAEESCQSLDAELLQFESDRQVQQFVALIKAGEMIYLVKVILLN